MYKVIHYFTDLQDAEHPYNVGDTFPREGLEVTEDRLAELASDKNRQGKPLIELVAEPVKVDEPKAVEAEPVKKAPKKKTTTAKK